jgi:hypothetical protein
MDNFKLDKLITRTWVSGWRLVGSACINPNLATKNVITKVESVPHGTTPEIIISFL